ncbi:hypothetical protein TNIN_22651 [Trichonephila inaurata madagascariensis]|uniref:Uncharacterized protein n=1 Tax=Trichonephila inaurata madagascariensis TaxID=2747483 RepID=A0A8X6Y965_9ARAC|nr:hypothetical protein TNIN_22651 [Trichonephila inaurata madagascariensis]
MDMVTPKTQSPENSEAREGKTLAMFGVPKTPKAPSLLPKSCSMHQKEHRIKTPLYMKMGQGKEKWGTQFWMEHFGGNMKGPGEKEEWGAQILRKDGRGKRKNGEHKLREDGRGKGKGKN